MSDDARMSPRAAALAASVPLGRIARRVPSVAAAERKACGASGDPSLPVRCISHADFADGVLRADGSQFLERLPEPPAGERRDRCALRPRDLVFSRVGGSYLGSIPDGARHTLVATENVIAMRPESLDATSAAAIDRYLFHGASGQLERLRSSSRRSIRLDGLAAVAVPAGLVSGTDESRAVLHGLEKLAADYSDASNAAANNLRELSDAAKRLDAALKTDSHPER